MQKIKVSKEEARTTALATFKSAIAPSVFEAELERGCLVYSLEVRVNGKEDVTEIHSRRGDEQGSIAPSTGTSSRFRGFAALDNSG
jgi:uncharacterized membrane protein YkoI